MKIALIGYGKMGRAIEAIALERGHTIGLKITSSNRGEFKSTDLSAYDVAIEFSRPEFAVENISYCFDAGVPVICGTTGWSQDLEKVKDECRKKEGSLLYASNFSVGVNIFFELNRKLAFLMKGYPEYNVQLEEIHHSGKKDSPSGTAISLAEDIIKELPTKHKWINELSTDEDTLSIISHRIDPAPGTHMIKWSSNIDDIEIIHTAHNRKGFALGALLGAEFIIGKKGIFGMKEVLGIV